MQQHNNVFSTGKYHRRFGRKNIHPLRRVLLRASYRASMRFIHRLGWSDPLAQTAPRALLCGTASPSTTITFVRFVQAHNRMAGVTILDISAYSLHQSGSVLKACRTIDGTNISFVEGDALHMPFADGCFNWIETDFFLQYFSSDERTRLFQEWYRVLRPGGVLTTRDWVRQRDNFIERVFEHAKNWLIRHVLGAIASSPTLQEVKGASHAIGCNVAIFPVQLALLRLRIPMMSYIFMQKPL